MRKQNVKVKTIIASLKQTFDKLGEEIIEVKESMRQRGSSPCAFFALFVNPLIRISKASAQDVWLKDLHILMLMDDTILLSTSRSKMQEKLNVLKHFWDANK